MTETAGPKNMWPHVTDTESHPNEVIRQCENCGDKYYGSVSDAVTPAMFGSKSCQEESWKARPEPLMWKHRVLDRP